MSASHGQLCRDLVGGSLIIKGRKVLDDHANANVNDLRVRGVLRNVDCISELFGFSWVDTERPHQGFKYDTVTGSKIGELPWPSNFANTHPDYNNRPNFSTGRSVNEMVSRATFPDAEYIVTQDVKTGFEKVLLVGTKPTGYTEMDRSAPVIGMPNHVNPDYPANPNGHFLWVHPYDDDDDYAHLLKINGSTGEVVDLTADNMATSGYRADFGVCYLNNCFTQLLSVGSGSIPAFKGPFTIWNPITGNADKTLTWNSSFTFTGTDASNFPPFVEGQIVDIAYDADSDRVYMLFGMYTLVRWIGWVDAGVIRQQASEPMRTEFDFTVTMLEHPASAVLNSIVFINDKWNPCNLG